MLKTANTASSRPDGVLLVIGYYMLMGIGFLFGALMVLATALPETWRIAAQDSLYVGGVVALVLTLALGIAVSLWMLLSARGLWLSKRTARASTLILSGVMTTVGLLAIPALMFAYEAGSMLGLSLIALSLAIALISAVAAWYLTRPEVKHYFDNAA